MGWVAADFWHPVLASDEKIDRDLVLDGLMEQLKTLQDGILPPIDDLKVGQETFRGYAIHAFEKISVASRTEADFVAAVGSDACVVKEGVIQDTALRTMSGAGHQHFLANMRNIVKATDKKHLYSALFEKWRYDDPVEKLTMRWDPIDDQRYALRSNNPSGDPSRKTRGSVLGANRLAIEGIPLLPVMPVGAKARTTGFRGEKSADTYLTWPIWRPCVDLDVVRAVLSLEELQEDSPPREELMRRGIIEVYRSQRITIGKFRNFTMGQPV
jgi:hypothetical protein